MEKLKIRLQLMTISINKILFGCFLTVIFYSSCSERVEFTKEVIPIYYDSGKQGLDTLIKSYPYYDTTQYKEGELELHYLTGELKEKSIWMKNQLINECKIYYKNGRLMEYRFYNVIGELRYQRQYSENGELKRSIGCPFIQVFSDYESGELKVGDSVNSQIYIASPPNCIHFVYGIGKDGKKYEVSWKHPKPYIYEFSRKFIKEGEFVLPFEVFFFDSIRNEELIYNEGIEFSVIK